MLPKFTLPEADRWLYFGIGGLTAAIGSGLSPHDWRFWAGSLLAGLIALKAKRSTGAGDSDASTTDTETTGA